jgi:hypothetical protein
MLGLYKSNKVKTLHILGTHKESEGESPTHSKDCAVIVMSCDAYRDLWPPFFSLLGHYWPDCPFPVFIGAEKRTWNGPRVVTLRSDAGSRNWSGRLIEYLGILRERYVIIMLDDFFLRKKVQTVQILSCLRFAREVDATQVRLIPRPGPTDSLPGERLVGECAPGLPYRLSTQSAIWNRQKLNALLRDGETIWDFEHNGNQRAKGHAHGFFATYRPVLPYEGRFSHHVVEKGRWLLYEKWLFSRQDIGCDFTLRESMSAKQAIFYHSAQFLNVVLGILPWRCAKKVRAVVKRGLRPFLQRQFARLAGTMK